MVATAPVSAQTTAPTLGLSGSPFFLPAAPPAQNLSALLPPAVRHRFVNVDFALLKDTLAGAFQDKSRKVAFTLFDDVTVEVATTSFELRSDGYAWSGSGSQNGADQIVVLTAQSGFAGDAVIAQLWSGSKRYSIQSVAGALHVISELDPTKSIDDEGHASGNSGGTSNDGPPSIFPVGATGTGGTPVSSAAAAPLSDNHVDILVVYTQAALTAQPGMVAWINNQIDQSNEANRRSSVPFKFRLAHQEAATYTETPNNIGTDLGRLRDITDNILDNVHTLRDTYGADVVVLVGSGWAAASQVCGISYQMNGTPSVSFASSAFAVVDVNAGCALSFTHEVGHVMALRHDWANSDGNNSAHTYNHGFSSIAGNFRTIMAYVPDGCVGGCPRIPDWSDPNVTFGGFPTGVAEGQPNPADNARTIKQTYLIVSQFRETIIGGVGSYDPGAVSWGPGRLDVFGRGTDSALKHTWWDGVGWAEWEDLGGGLASSPDAASWAAGRLDVFVQGTDNQIWHKWYEAGTWYGWDPLGGSLTSAPGSVSWAAQRIDVFARGTNNTLKHKWYDAGTWYGWEDLGGGLTSGPDAASRGAGRLDVFVRGTDNGLWHKWYDAPNWSNWESLGGGLNSDPTVVSWGGGRLDVFIQGTDNQLWHKWYDGLVWSNWEPLGGVLTSGPDASSWANGRLDVFARGTNNAIWHRYYENHQWADWTPHLQPI
jgi:hypothetical protein